MNPTIFAKLRNVLARLFPDESSIRCVVEDAGLDQQKIDFGSSAINVWHFVLTEAEKVDRIEALLQVVESEYGNNREFQAACQAYRQSQGNQETVNRHGNVSAQQPKLYPKTWQQRLPSVVMGIALIGLAGGGAYWMLGRSPSGGNVTPTSTTSTSSAVPSEEKSAEDSSTPTELPTAMQATMLPSPTSIANVATATTAITPTATIPQPTDTPSEVASALCSFAFLVLDEQSEEPIRRAKITVFVGVRQETGTTDSNGYYLAKLPCHNEQDVEAQVRVSADDYSPYNTSVFLSNEITEILLEHKMIPILTTTITPMSISIPQPMVTMTLAPLTTIGYTCTATTTTKSNANSIRLLTSPAGGVRKETIPTKVTVQILKRLKNEGLAEIWYGEEEIGGWMYDENLILADFCPE